MKKYMLLYALIMLTCTPQANLAKIGCMSNTQNLKNLYDYKTYHYVECSCPCGSSSQYAILQNRGVCRQCGHFHELKPMHLIKGSIPKNMPRPSHNPIVRFFQKTGSLLY